MIASTFNEVTETSLKSSWNETEKWIWDKLSNGEEADLNSKFNKAVDAKIAGEWTEDRVITPKFLQTILLNESYYPKLMQHGLIISGAWIKEPLDLNNARIKVEWQLINSRLEADVYLSLLQSNNLISFENSCFAKFVDLSYVKVDSYLNFIAVKIQGDLDMNSLSIGTHLFMRDQAEFKNVNLRNAKINGQLDLSRTIISGELDMDSLSIGSSLFMRHSQMNQVSLRSARITGQIDMESIKLTGKLDMDSIAIGSSLFMRNNALFTNVSLLNAKISDHTDISGSKVTETLDMNSISVANSLFMRDGAEFNNISLLSASIGGQVDMSSTKVNGSLDMNSITIKNSLFLREKGSFNDVLLINSKIMGQLDLSGSEISGTLDMNSIYVGGSLFMREGSVFNTISLISGKVAGQLNMSGAKVLGFLDMGSVSVGSHLFMNDKAEFNNVSLVSAKIDGQIDTLDAVFSGELNIESASIQEHAFLRAAKYSGKLNFILSNVGGSVYLYNTELTSLDFGGTQIRGELHIGSIYGDIKWTNESFMNLRNTGAGAIQDGDENSWPHELNLDGFSYFLLGGFFGQENLPDNNQIAERESKWFVNWLAKDKSYSPQPYNQLADVLRNMGYSEKANAVLYAGKNRERDEARSSKQWVKWSTLSMLKWTIGYGFGGRYFRSLIWVLCLTLIGVYVLSTLHLQTLPNFWDKFAFSTDMLLPIIQLDNRYKLDFYGWQLYYFYFHELMGFLLGSFVVAGLSGITKK